MTGCGEFLGRDFFALRHVKGAMQRALVLCCSGDPFFHGYT